MKEGNYSTLYRMRMTANYSYCEERLVCSKKVWVHCQENKDGGPYCPPLFGLRSPFLQYSLYFVWLAVLQWRGSNQGLIYDYPATQTAQAAQTEQSDQMTATAQEILSNPTEMPVATQTQTP